MAVEATVREMHSINIEPFSVIKRGTVYPEAPVLLCNSNISLPSSVNYSL